MEETLDKLFNLLEDKKNESLFKLIISQIVQINRQYPNNTSSRIFEKILKMAESNIWETRLVAASLIEKIYDNHSAILESFLKNEQAQIDALNGILVYEPAILSSDIVDLTSKKAVSLYDLQKLTFLDPKLINYEELIENSQPLYACALDTMEDAVINEQKEKEILSKLSGNMDDDKFFFNYLEFLNSLDTYNEKEPNNEKANGSPQDNGNKGKDAKKTGDKKSKNSKKDKKHDDMPAPSKKVKLDEIMQNSKTFRLKACSLMNLVHRYACQNIIDSKWEKRHGSTLLLKSLIKADIRLLVLNLEVEKSVFADSVSVARAIKETIMEQSNTAKFYKDALARSLIILSLDRFSDFVADKAHIVVRETACQLISRLMNKDVWNEELEDQLFSAMKCLLRRKEWEVRIGVITCLNNLLMEDKKRFATKIFDYFWESLPQDENDEIIHVFAECFQYLITPQLFTQHLDKVRIVAKNLWNVILRLDDITYATSALTNLLRLIHQEAPDINEIYSDGFNVDQNFEILLVNFHHSIQEVRHNNYVLIQKLLAVLKFNKSELQILQKLMIGTAQNLLVETDASIIHILEQVYGTLIERSWHIDSSFIKSHLDWAFMTATFTNLKAMISEFKSFHMSSHFPSYSFVEVPQEPYNLENLAYQRINKLFDALFKSFINVEPLAEYFVQKILRPNFESNFMYVYMYLLFLSHLHYSTDKGKDIFKKYYDEKLLLTMLNWSYFDTKRPDLQSLANEIQNSVSNVLNQLAARKVSAVDNLIKRFPLNQKISVNSLEELYNQMRVAYNDLKEDQAVKNVVVAMESSIYMINTYVLRSNDFLCLIKSLAAGVLILDCKLKGEIDKLNLVIKPVMQMLNKSQSTSIAQLLGYFLLTLVRLVQHKTPNPIPKILKNIMNLFGTEPEASQANLINYKQEFKISSNIKALEYLTTDLVKDSGIKFIEKFPEYRDSTLGELQPFQISTKESKAPINYEKMKVLKVLKILKRIRQPLLMTELQAFRVEVVKGCCLVFRAFRLIDQEKFKSSKLDEFALLKSVLSKMLLLLRANGLWSEINMTFTEINNYIESEPSPGAFLFLEEFFNKSAKDYVEYAKIFLVPSIKFFTGENKFLRNAAQRCFSALVKCTWIEVPDMVKIIGQSPFLIERYDEGNFFLKNLTHKSTVDIQLKTKVNAKLRSYQLEGVSWMNFLFSFNLNGALCDDMGLGKTLQTLVVMQESIYQEFHTNKPTPKFQNRSIIIVPSSLIDHWLYEVKRYCDESLLRGFAHSTPQKNEDNFNNGFNLMVISYQSFVKNYEQFEKSSFFFAILDEAHLVKNPKSKFSQKIKLLKATHKLILTGTPIQNNIVELWNIFDFLMPGYLGTEEDFRQNFSKYFNTNLLKFKDIDLEFSTLQDDLLSDLHRKVMPFIMRRDKMTVLSELPPKIIQDHYCTLTPIQEFFYKEFETQEVGQCESELQLVDEKTQETTTTADPIKKAGKNVLKLLTSLRKICNHPYMLVKNADTDSKFRLPPNTKLADLQTYEASGKLLALRDLFNEFGFGDDENANQEDQFMDTKDKVILFTKYTETLDIIVNLFLKKLFSNLNYLRIDGRINASKRFSIVNQFNNDPDCHLILVTTTVGGVGLNLSSANRVIMFDHDYNPMNDLQAIDRAHRIGQKNTLLVYRLIMKGTLEEQIMGIQKFKLNVANAVINVENSSTDNLKKSNLLSLFSGIKVDLETEKKDETIKASGYGDRYSKVLEGMDELWDEDQYEKEY